MRVFFIWSGQNSGKAAHALRELMRATVQGPEYFISDEIEPGTLWRMALAGALNEADFGIILFTPDNIDNPWIHFEAGAIAKTVSTAQVIPLLIGLDASEISGPLSSFQSVRCDEDGVRKIVYALASKNTSHEDVVSEIFDWKWPRAKTIFSELETEYESPIKKGVQPLSKEEQLLGELRSGDGMYFASNDEAWRQAEKHLHHIMTFFGLEGISAYASRGSDFKHLERTARVGIDVTGNSLSVESYKAVLELQEHDFYYVSSKNLKQMTFHFSDGAASGNVAMLMREVFGGRVILFCIAGLLPFTITTTMRRLALAESLNIVSHQLDQAYQGITLDQLALETAHNLGRALGGVSASKDYIGKLLDQQKFEPDERKLYDEALMVLGSSIERLRIIRSNFYNFSETRLLISQADSGSIERAKGSLNVKGIIDNACEVFRGILGQYGEKTLVSRTESIGDISIVGSKEELSAVLHNLLDNALKFSFERTDVVVVVNADSELCTISISNVGFGIPRDERYRVFDPFVKSSTHDGARQLPGSGLGLTYCKKIIEKKFSGSFDLESTMLGGEANADGNEAWKTIARIVLPITSCTEGDIA